MKKLGTILCLGALVFSLPTLAQTKKNQKGLPVAQTSNEGYGMAGCGLGSIVFGNQPGLIQILAGTTNGTLGSQTFGISSGTSNCEERGGDAHRSAALFITANRDALEKDASRGGGEAVSTLSQIMGCDNSQLLGRKLQRNFKTIFPSKSASDEQVVDSIMSEVQSDEALSANCGNVG